jgi:carbon monoxide dehydrogenase subunit G
MATTSRTTNIPTPPDAVWGVLADFASISSWAPNVDHSCLLTEQSSGVGAVRRIQAGRLTVVETVIGWADGSSLSYAITGLPKVLRSVTNTWHVEPSADGRNTTVTLTTDIDAGPRPAQRVLAGTVARGLGSTSEEMLAGLTSFSTARI